MFAFIFIITLIQTLHHNVKITNIKHSVDSEILLLEKLLSSINKIFLRNRSNFKKINLCFLSITIYAYFLFCVSIYFIM